MNKIGTNELIYDENGHAISGSAVSKLLKAQGVDTYDKEGNKRSTFDVLYDLSKKWDNISDAEQQQLATAIAGTRQYSNFSAIMQGMQEGKIDDYMELIGQSSGITNKKFDVYTDSLEASLTNLRNTFDDLVHDLTDNGTLTGIINFFSRMVQGVDNLANSMGGLEASMVTVVPMLVGLTALKVGAASGQGYLALAGAAVLAAGVGITALAGSANTKSQNVVAQEKYTEAKEGYESRYSDIQNKINRAETLASKKQSERTEDETKELNDLKRDLSVFASVSSAAIGTSSSLEGLQAAISELGNSAQSTSNAIKQLNEINNQQKANEIRANVRKQAASLVGSFYEASNTYNDQFHATNGLFYNKLWKKNPETGKYEMFKSYDDFKKEIDSGVAKSYDTNPITRLFYKPDDVRTWDKDYAPVLASELARISPYFGDDVPEAYHNKDEESWLKIIKIDDKIAHIPDSVFKYLMDDLNAQAEYDINGFNYQKNEFENEVAKSLVGNAPDELIPYIAKGIVESSYSQMFVDGQFVPMTNDEFNALLTKEIDKAYGFDINNPSSYAPQSMQASLREYAQQYKDAHPEDKYDEWGIEIGDYYQIRNGDRKGETISYDEARQIRDYEASTVEVWSKDGKDKLASYRPLYEGSREAALSKAEGQKWYSYTDQQGVKHYFTDKGKAEEDLQAYKDNEAQWQYNYEFPDSGASLGLKGTQADLEAQTQEMKATRRAYYQDPAGNFHYFYGEDAREQAEAARPNYYLLNRNVNPLDLHGNYIAGYAFENQALQAQQDLTKYYLGEDYMGMGLYGYNHQQAALKADEQAMLAGRNAWFYDPFGKRYDTYGENAEQEAREQMEALSSKDRYYLSYDFDSANYDGTLWYRTHDGQPVVDENGNPIFYGSEKESQKAASALTKYYYGSDLVGIGDEGYQAQQDLVNAATQQMYSERRATFTDLFGIPHTFQGKDAEGHANDELNRMLSEYYLKDQFGQLMRNSDGTPYVYANEAEASRAAEDMTGYYYYNNFLGRGKEGQKYYLLDDKGRVMSGGGHDSLEVATQAAEDLAEYYLDNELVGRGREGLVEQSKRLSRLTAEVEASRTASYTDMFDRSYTFTGVDAYMQAQNALKAQQQAEQYYLFNSAGTDPLNMNGYQTEEAARADIPNYTTYYLGDEEMGVGAEGLAARQKALAYYSSNQNMRNLINGVDVGSYEHAQAILNSGQAYYNFDARTGEILGYYSDWEDLKANSQKGEYISNSPVMPDLHGNKHLVYTREQIEKTPELWEDSGRLLTAEQAAMLTGGYSRIQYEPGRAPTPSVMMPQVIRSNNSVVPIVTPADTLGFSGVTFTEGTKPLSTWSSVPESIFIGDQYEFGGFTEGQKPREALSIAPIVRAAEDFVDISTDIILEEGKLSSFGSDLKSHVKGFATSIDKKLLGGAIDVVEEATQIVDGVAGDFEEGSTLELKTVTDHFMGSVTSNAQVWKSNNESKIAADDMLRLYQDAMRATEGKSELERLQFLYDYINFNDIAEWSILARSSPEFARILSGIADDDAGHITYAQEGILNEIEQGIYSMSSQGAKQRSLSERGNVAISALNKVPYLNTLANTEKFLQGRNVDEALDRVFGTGTSDFARDENGVAWFVDRVAAGQAYQSYVKNRKEEEERRIQERSKQFQNNPLMPQDLLTEDGELDIDAYKRFARKRQNKAYRDEYDTLRLQYERDIADIRKFYDAGTEAEFYRDNNIQYLNDSELQAVQSIVGDEYMQRLRARETTSVEQAWAMMRAQNAANGIEGMTDTQKLVLAAQTFGYIKNGELTEKGFSLDTPTTVKQDVTSGISGLNKLYEAEMMLEANGNGYTLADLYNTEKRAGLQEALGNLYDIDDLQNLFRSSEQASALASFVNTPYYKELTSLYEGFNSPLETDRISTMQGVMSSQSKIARANNALERLDTSKTFEELDDAVVDELASATNYTKDQIKNMWKEDRSGARAKLQASINAQRSQLYDAYSAFFESEAAGFSELQFDESMTLSTDELVEKLSGIEGFNKGVIEWVKATGMAIVNGKKVFNEGSEDIHKSLAESQAEENTKGQARIGRLNILGNILNNGNIPSAEKYNGIIDWYNAAEEGADALAGTSLGYLISQYQNPDSGVTVRDLTAAYNAEVLGGGNAFASNGYYLRQLFGSEDIASWNVNTARENYARIRNDSALAEQVNRALRELGINTDLFTSEGAISEDVWAEVTKAAYQAYLGTGVDKETAEKMAILKYGTGYQKDQIYNQSFEAFRTYNQAVSASQNLGLSSNRSILSQATGMSQEYIDQLYQSGDQEEIQRLLKNQYEKLIKDPLMQMAAKMAGVDLSQYGDLDSALEALRAAAARLGNEALESVEMLAEYMENASEAAQLPTDFGKAFDEAMKSLEESNSQNQGLYWLMSNFKDAFENAEKVFEQGDYTEDEAIRHRFTQDEETGRWYDNEGVEKSVDHFRHATSREAILQAIANDPNAPTNWSWLQNTPGMAAAFSLVDSGRWTSDQAVEYASKAFYNGNKTTDYYSGILRPLFNDNEQGIEIMDSKGRINIDWSDNNQVQAFIDAYDAIKNDASANKVLEEASERYGDLGSAAENASKNANKAKQQIERFNEGVNAKAAQEVTQYSKAINKDLVSALSMFGNGGQDTRAAMALWKNGMKQIANQAAAVKKAMGGDVSGEDLKKARERKQDQTSTLLSELTGIDLETIEEMSSQDLQDLLGDSVTELNQRMSQGIEALLQQNPIHIDMGSVDTNVDGEVDLTELAAAYTAAGDIATAEALAVAGHYATITFEVSQSGQVISVDAVVDASKGTTSKKGGGGGGGGKSDVDKLLEKQKHEIGQITHKQKMLESEEKQLEFNLDYESQRANIEDQIGVQKELISTYGEHIQALNDMLAKTKEGTDDWWKLKEAIDAAKESIEEAKNAINELKIKNIETFITQYEKKDRPQSHAQSMREKFASIAMSEDRFADYVAETEAEIEEVKNRRETKEKLISELKQKLAGLAKTTENEGERDKLKEEIEKAQEEVTDFDVELIEAEKQLQSERLNHVAQILSQNTQTATHNQTIASTFAGAYESAGYRDQYEAMIARQMMENDELIKHNIVARDETLKLIAELEQADENGVSKKGTTAWFEAQAALYGYEEAIAEATVSQLEFNRALEESKMEKTIESYTDATRELTQVQTLLSSFADEALERKDYEAYFASIDRYLETTPAKLDAARSKLASLQEQYTLGMEKGLLDPEMQRQLLDEINSAEQELTEIERDERSRRRQYAEQKITQVSERQSWEQANYDSNLKVLGYQSSTYQNLGELTNYNTMLKTETKLRDNRVKALQKDKEELEATLQYVESGSEEEKKLLELIRQKDEAIASENAQIEKNTKLREENEKKIMQIQKTVTDSIDKEIEAQKKRDRDMLSGTVSLQNSILDVLKKRLQEEWNLKKKDIEKEKESLNEYKKLINERYNYRKQASTQADKDEEIADYRRQLALLEADPTRTKDAKDIRRKLEELEKERSWTVAQGELDAENERIDNEIETRDKFIQYNEELLSDLLGDANNFADEMNEILVGSFEESYNNIIEFMQKENEAFIKSLPEAQQQMIQSWEDTAKKAYDIVDNNYAEIDKALNLYDENGVLKSYEELSGGTYQEDYIEWMKAHDRQYRSYLEAGDKLNMQLLERQWKDTYSTFLSSIKDDAVFTETDYELGDVVSLLEELDRDIYDVDVKDIDLTGFTAPTGFSDSDQLTQDFSTYSIRVLDDLDEIYKAIVPSTPKPHESTHQSSTGGGGGGTPKKKPEEPEKSLYSVAELFAGAAGVDPKAALELGMGPLDTTERFKVEGDVSDVSKVKKVIDTKTGEEYVNPDYKDPTTLLLGSTPSMLQPDKFTEQVLTSKIKSLFSPLAFANGGLVDFTGPAWVDGTRAHPESFLDATDTALLRNMLDSFNFIRVNANMTHVDPSMYGDNTNVGDINITINQAELKSDADYEQVAKRVGQAFSKELKRNGLNLSGYAFG